MFLIPRFYASSNFASGLGLIKRTKRNFEKKKRHLSSIKEIIFAFVILKILKDRNLKYLIKKKESTSYVKKYFNNV